MAGVFNLRRSFSAGAFASRRKLAADAAL